MSNADEAPTIAQLQSVMDESLERFLTLIDTYNDEQMLTPTDAAGWNVRDHLTHLVAWADGLAALLRREARWEAMGVPPEVVNRHDVDEINAVIVVQNRNINPADARIQLIYAHQGVVTAMNALTDADLMRPYDHFVAPFNSDEGHPIYGYILGNTAHHYDEHTPWIEAIVAKH